MPPVASLLNSTPGSNESPSLCDSSHGCCQLLYEWRYRRRCGRFAMVASEDRSEVLCLKKLRSAKGFRKWKGGQTSLRSASRSLVLNRVDFYVRDFKRAFPRFLMYANKILHNNTSPKIIKDTWSSIPLSRNHLRPFVHATSLREK